MEHPIIYVRGFAATEGEIEDTVADPYMGFNLGSTKSRMLWTGKVGRFFFESPLVRLMSEYDYDDVFVDGEDLLGVQRSDNPIGYKCIIIFRFYDEASDTFGTGSTPPIEHFAKELNKLVLTLRDKVCANSKNNVKPEDFRVNLVAHSMGGLVCRAFLQNPDLGSTEARQLVDKVFTYATPHNGIDLRIIRNVPGWATLGDVNNFSREKMAEYLALPKGAPDVSLVSGIPVERVFNLVGTNSTDYKVLRGLSSWAAGDRSDGLVRIENAVTHALDDEGKNISSPSAFVHRSHSGHYGIVNSEEGYQNLTRFLFGNLRVDGVLNIDAITLPEEIEKKWTKKPDLKLKASYQIETVVSIRGCQWQMHRRTNQENSAIFRTYDALFPLKDGKRTPDYEQSPRLFSLFLDQSKSVKRTKSVSFGVDLNILVPDYELDGTLFLDRHYEGGFIYRNFLVIEAIPDKAEVGGWKVKVGNQIDNAGKADEFVAVNEIPDGSGVFFEIPVVQSAQPGIRAKLVVTATQWK